MDFLREMDKTFAENLTHYLSWRLEFSEEVDYGVSATA